MSSNHGLPLLSGPPPQVESSDACRKCNKEFNILFSRSRKCNHCGYLYCHSCSDFQALMPRTGPESLNGYDPMNVCAYCIEFLNITAAGIGQLRGMSPSKLKSYADAYSIDVSRAVEKGDIIDAIVRARDFNGCLPREKEDFYRRNKVPNPYAGTRPRGIFSRTNMGNPPPVPPRPQSQANPSFPRPDLGFDNPPPNPPPPPPRPYSSYSQPPPPPPPRNQHYPQYPPPPPQQPTPQPNYNHQPPPYQPYHHGYHPQQHYNAPPYHPSFHQAPPPPPPPPPQSPPDSRPPPPPPPPRPNTSFTNRPAQAPQTQSTPTPSPPRPRTTSTPSRAQAHAPSPPATSMPTLDQLLIMTQTSIATLPISVLKNILFTNHVNASMILEKSELVKKVLTLIEDEKKERERQRMAEEAERLLLEERRREREGAIRSEQEEKRRREEEERLRRERNERRERQRVRMEEVGEDEDEMREVEVEVSEESSDEDQWASDTWHDEQEEKEEGPSASTSTSATSNTAKPTVSAALERSGLCVICQDEEANIAIVDCGHMAMCRACSDLIMTSTRECPLCRTRIVTEARLLRIFKS